MNYCGSYRHLLKNSKAAMLAAIEIYNKPRFDYRDECFVILLLNAWELALKALLSKKKKSIYYPKKKDIPYRTLSWEDALKKSEPHFPKGLNPLPIRRNLGLIGTYRNNAVHFYNEKDFSVLVYALAQTSIVNYRDLLKSAFDIEMEDEINWSLLPLGIKPPIDPIAYLSGKKVTVHKRSSAVKQFISELSNAVSEVQDSKCDLGRLMTVFNVKLESTKKIDKADIVVGVQKPTGESNTLAIVRPQDPNIMHPLRQKDVLQQITELHGIPITSHVFQALAWKHSLKGNPTYCWQASEGVLTKYSNDVIVFLRRLTKANVLDAIHDYRDYLKKKKKQGNDPGD